jgi:hypothetical protein
MTAIHMLDRAIGKKKKKGKTNGVKVNHKSVRKSPTISYSSSSSFCNVIPLEKEERQREVSAIASISSSPSLSLPSLSL